MSANVKKAGTLSNFTETMFEYRPKARMSEPRLVCDEGLGADVGEPGVLGKGTDTLVAG